MPPLSSSRPDAAAIRAAAQWLVRLHAEDASSRDIAACARWRAAHPMHEQAWQKAERLSRQFGAVPPALGVPVLTRSTAAGTRRAALRTLATLAVAAPAVWLAWRKVPWQGWVADHATATGVRQQIPLPDGSLLSLNTDTAVDLAWSDTERRVVLHRGEIYVHTAPDTPPEGHAPRPFIVVTPQGRLRALGTRFAVRLEPGMHGAAPTTRLTVLEHRVEVTAHTGASHIVDAGQALHFTAHRIGPPQPLGADPMVAAGAPGWTLGTLYADDMRLDAFLDELARYRTGVIRCAPEVAGLRISGAYQIADTDQALRMLASTLPVVVTQHTRWWVTVNPRPH